MNFWMRVLATLYLSGTTTWASAECVSRVASPSTAPRTSWSDLLNLKADKSLNKSINFVQLIEKNGDGDVNLDTYAITIDSKGSAPSQIMADLRKNIGTYIYKTGSYKVEALDADSATTWGKADPTGAVMVFTLAAFGPIPLERGAVVVSCADANSFVFSTINIGSLFNGAEDHPVAGNRGFGVAQNADGSITIFTKAADRRKSNNILFQKMGSAKIFEKGAEVWKGLLANLKSAYADRSPRAEVVYARQEAWK